MSIVLTNKRTKIGTAFDVNNTVENQQIESFFPQSGGASGGAKISLSEVTDMSTLFLSNDVILRLNVENQLYDFKSVVSNGIGMLTGYPQIGHSYGDWGFPFGMDSYSVRMPHNRLW